MGKNLRVVTGQISHETNTFSVIPADASAFAERGVHRGTEISSVYGRTRTPLGGIIDAAAHLELELIPTIAASAHPSGRVTREVYDGFKDELLSGTAAAMKDGLDGVLLALHGAMVVEGLDDGEGDLLQALRQLVGPDIPIVCTLDFHANLTEMMVENANLLLGYNQYPHVDAYDRGVEAGEDLSRMLRAGLEPVMVLRKPPLLPPLVAQKTSTGPFSRLYALAYEWEERPAVIDACIYGGFPYADIEAAGMGILVTTDANPTLAEKVAAQLEERAQELRDEFVVSLSTPAEAVKQAVESDGRPAVIADVADNPGAGGSCDATAILQALLDQGVDDAALFLCDPEAAQFAVQGGVGSRLELALGAKRDSLHGKTLHVSAYVKTLSDGVFTYKGPQSRGLRGELGTTAVFDIQGVDVVVGSRRVQTLDPEIFRCVGVEPTDKKVVVLKSSVHYRAAFEPIAATIIEAAGPGVANPDLSQVRFEHVRRPIFPLDRE